MYCIYLSFYPTGFCSKCILEFLFWHFHKKIRLPSQGDSDTSIFPPHANYPHSLALDPFFFLHTSLSRGSSGPSAFWQASDLAGKDSIIVTTPTPPPQIHPHTPQAPHPPFFLPFFLFLFEMSTRFPSLYIPLCWFSVAFLSMLLDVSLMIFSNKCIAKDAENISC